MNTNALLLFSSLYKFLTSHHQRENFKALMALLLEANGRGRAEHVEGKSPAAISRFLNVRSWNVRAMVRTLRQAVAEELAQRHLGKRGRRPLLYALIDLTTLEKSGDFPHLPILVLNNKRGLQLVQRPASFPPVVTLSRAQVSRSAWVSSLTLSITNWLRTYRKLY